MSLRRWRFVGLRAGAAAITGILLGGLGVAATAAAGPDASELRASSDRARHIFTALPYGANPLGARIASTGVDPASGAVTIALANYSDELAGRIRARYGADVVVRPGALPQLAVLRERKGEARIDLTRRGGAASLAEGLCANETYCSPTRGGVLLQAQSGDYVYSCTATILGTDNGTGNATMTAGHCFDLSATVYAGRTNPSVGGYPLGTVTSRRFSGNADAETIRWSTGDTAYNYLTNCVWAYSTDCQRMTVGGGGYNGMAVQKSGITTGLTSGTITRSSVSVNVADDDGTVTTLTDQIETSACVIPGDSGGPLFAGSQLLGISSAVGGLDANGNCTANTRSYFTKLGNGNAAIGFRPRFTP